MAPGRVALLAVGAAYGVLLGWQAVSLPVTVPAHVDAGGDPTRWGTLGGHLAFAVVMGISVVGVFWAVPWLTGRLPAELVNLPDAEYWLRPENLATTRRRLADETGWLGAATLVLVGYAVWMLGRVALGRPSHPAVLWVLVAALLVGAVAHAVRSRRTWRAPEQ